MRGRSSWDGDASQMQTGLFRAAGVIVLAVLLVSSVALIAQRTGEERLGLRLPSKQGSDELLETGEKDAILKELLRRQNSMTAIEKSLQEEQEQSQSVLMRLLSHSSGKAKNGTEAGNSSLDEGSAESVWGVRNESDVVNGTGSGLDANGTSRDVDQAFRNSTLPAEQGANESMANTSNSSTEDGSNVAIVENITAAVKAEVPVDEYADARRLFAPMNDTAEIDVALKEQPITEYSNQTIR